MPDIDAVSLTGSPDDARAARPGVAATATLTLQNVGNVSETVTLSTTTPAGLTAGSLGTVTLAPGATQTETLTLTPDASATLNQTLATTITASFGPSSTPVTTTDEIDLLVRSAQTVAVSQAAIAAGSANNTQLSSVLTDLGNTLASLQTATSSALFTEAQNRSRESEHTSERRSGFALAHHAASADHHGRERGQSRRHAVGDHQPVQQRHGVLNQEASEQFTASLSPTEVDVQPGQGQTLTLTLTNTASDAETLNLSVGNLPTGATVQLGQSQVNLAAGASTTVPVTLSQTIQSSTVFTLDVTANAGVVQQSASAVVSITPATADVTSVTATPQAVNARDSIAVSAQVFNTANVTRDLEAQLQVLDSSGNVVSTAPVVPFSIDPSNQSVSVNLGNVDTTGLADGLYSLQVSLLTSVGTPLPGHSAETPLLIGIPITATATASSSLLAPGTSTVTTTIQAQNATNVGGVTYNNATDFSLTGNPNGAWSYGYLSPGALPDSSTFAPFANSVNNGGLQVWNDSVSSLAAFDNPTNSVLHYGSGVLQPGEAGFHPGPNGQYSVYRFTAPATGSYSLSALFTGIDDAGGTTTDVHVLDDGTSLFQGDINGYLNTSSYSATLNLKAGDIIDFAVGYGSDGSYLFDSTGLDATLTFNGAGSSGEDFVLYYTQYSGSQNVRQAVVNYNGSSFSIVSQKTVAGGFAGDGLVFAPDGSLLIGSGGPYVYEVNPITGSTTRAYTGGSGAFHLALDPSGKFLYTAAQPGAVGVIPLDPFGNGTSHAVTGDDNGVAAIAFDSSGNAYYTTSNGGYDTNSNFGRIDLTTFTTTRTISGLVAAHGMTFDPFTGDMILVGGNQVAQVDLKTMTVVSTLTLGNPGSYQLDQGTADGHGHLFVCDNFGHLLFIDYSQTGLVGDPSDFVAIPKFDSYPDDVAPLSSLGAISALLEVQHFVPSSGYTVDTSSITPTPGSSTSTEIDWLGGLLAGSSSTQQFQLTGQVTNMAPGEVRQISPGTSLNVQFTSGSGQQLQATLSLPPVTVAAEHIISLTPPNQGVDRGSDASYTVTLTNPYATDVTYDLSTAGLDGFTANLATSVTVPAGQSMTTALDVSIPLTAAADTTGFEVLATTTGGVSDSVQGELTVTPQVALQSYAVSLGLSPTQATAGQGTSAQYVLTVTNAGSVEDTYSLAVSGLPQGVTSKLGQTSVDVPPGASNFRDILLNLTVAKGTTPGSYPFTVTATSTSDSTVTSTTNGTLTVTAGGVQVTLNPPSGAPGSGFQATVTNTGTVTDTYNLALAGPAALVASLGTKQVTLAPGASQVVPINTGAVDFAVQGTLGLTAVATSAANPAVQGAASSNLAIPATSGLTAEFSPATQTLAAPGTATFLLMVHNSGNTEDSYRATIMGANGPVTATLIGLDGSPTQSIPTFILPGLSTGAIELQVDLSAVGTGIVTVQVKSLTNSETASPDAVTIVNPHTFVPGSSHGPQVVKVQRYGYHMMPTTLVLTFNEALDPATAENVHNYRIVGLRGRRISILRAVYNATRQTVTLHPAQRLSVHHPYEVTVIGKGLKGLTNVQGQLLEGTGRGQPGADYHLELTWRELVLGHVSRAFLIREHIVRTGPESKAHRGDSASGKLHAHTGLVHPLGPLVRPVSSSLLRADRHSSHRPVSVRG